VACLSPIQGDTELVSEREWGVEMLTGTVTEAVA
jgi:hypothetical protein